MVRSNELTWANVAATKRATKKKTFIFMRICNSLQIDSIERRCNSTNTLQSMRAQYLYHSRCRCSDYLIVHICCLSGIALFVKGSWSHCIGRILLLNDFVFIICIEQQNLYYDHFGHSVIAYFFFFFFVNRHKTDVGSQGDTAVPHATLSIYLHCMRQMRRTTHACHNCYILSASSLTVYLRL